MFLLEDNIEGSLVTATPGPSPVPLPHPPHAHPPLPRWTAVCSRTEPASTRSGSSGEMGSCNLGKNGFVYKHTLGGQLKKLLLISLAFRLPPRSRTGSSGLLPAQSGQPESQVKKQQSWSPSIPGVGGLVATPITPVIVQPIWQMWPEVRTTPPPPSLGSISS